MNLWRFLLAVLFFLIVIQGLRYLFLRINLKREKEEMKERLKSDRRYNIFEKPPLKFDMIYDNNIFLEIENESDLTVKNLSINLSFREKTMPMIVDVPPGKIEIPVEIETSSGGFELNLSFNYVYRFQRFSGRITRYFFIKEEKSIKEIKKEYRELVKKYHPDLAKNEEERKYFESQLEKINEKYSKILKEKRSVL